MERRDEVDQARIAGTSQARGWANLESLVDLAVDAEHPANAWLRGHHQTSAERTRRALAEAADDNALRDDAPAESIARGLIAAMDGLQLQWLSDPGCTDMATDFATLLEAARYRWG